jgi:hypothetical protein
LASIAEKNLATLHGIGSCIFSLHFEIGGMSSLQSCQIVRFQTKNPTLGKFWRVLYVMENLGIFYDHLVNYTAIGNILWPFGIFYGHFGIFSPVLVYCTKKNLATLLLFTTNFPEQHFFWGGAPYPFNLFPLLSFLSNVKIF